MLGLDRIIITTFRRVAVVVIVTAAIPVGFFIVNFTATTGLMFGIVDYVATILKKKIKS